MKALLVEINELLIGNNQPELAQILAHLKNLPGSKVITEIAFDVKGALQRLSRFSPNFIPLVIT